MTKALFVVDGISGPANKSSSLAQYQFGRYAVEEFDTTIISSKEINEPTITSAADDTVTPSFGKFTMPILFPMFVVVHALVNWRTYDLYLTNHAGLPITPILLLNHRSIDWIILSHDSPDGASIRIQRHDVQSLHATYTWIMSAIARFGLYMCDQVILSDETDMISERKKTVVRGGADCRKIDEIKDEIKDEIEPQNADEQRTAVRVVYVGNLYIHRGIDILLEGVDHSTTNIELILIGPRPPFVGSEENQREFNSYFTNGFESKLNEIDATCEYRGVLDQDEAIREMLRADIGLCILPYERGLPHFKQSYPIKIFEYMAAELSVACTRTPAMETLLDDAQLIDSHEVSEVATTIDELARDCSLRQECSQRNKRVAKDYCWNRLLEDIDEAIKKR
jgi:glycosyltransferase involved in cell wall biosynthesis